MPLAIHIRGPEEPDAGTVWIFEPTSDDGHGCKRTIVDTAAPDVFPLKEADRRLMEAVPELLSACEAAEETLAAAIGRPLLEAFERNPEVVARNLSNRKIGWIGVINRLRAAIAKTRGEKK